MLAKPGLISGRNPDSLPGLDAEPRKLPLHLYMVGNQLVSQDLIYLIRVELYESFWCGLIRGHRHDPFFCYRLPLLDTFQN